MKRQFYIYKLTSPSGMVYIGQTYDIRNRFYNYSGPNGPACHKQKLLYNAIKKYGWKNFQKKILVNGIYDNKRINMAEQSLIKRYKNLGISMNITDGGEGRNGTKGKNNKQSIPILQFDKSNKLIKRWDCITAIIEELGSGAIHRAMKKDFYYKGSFWIPEHLYKESMQFKRGSTCRGSRVLQYTLTGEFIKEYHSIREAELQNNIKLGVVWASIKRGNKKSKGFIWKLKP